MVVESIPFIVAITALFFLSRSNICGIFRGSLINPFFFLLTLLIIIAIDFFVLYGDVYINIYESVFSAGKLDVASAWLFFSLCSFAMVFGVYCAIFIFNAFSLFSSINSIFIKINKFNYKYFVYIFGGVSFAFIMSNIGALLSAEVSRQVLFRENLIFSVMYAMLPIAYSLYINKKNQIDLDYILITTFCLISLFFSGSRGGVVFLFIIVAVWFSEKIFVTQFLIVPVFFVVPWILAFIRYYFRETWRYNSFFDFMDDNGGIFNLFFGTAEVSFAEVITTTKIFYEKIDRNYLDSILAFFMYPFPRSIFEFKPISSDALVTEFLSPIRWETAKSEIVISGFSDFLLSFGYWGAIFAVFFVGILWGAISVFSMKSSNRVVFVPLCMWWMYLFVRSGIFNMAASFWAFLGLIVFGLFFSGVIREK